MADTALAIKEETPVMAQADNSAAIMNLIERAARDESVDIDKMERLFTMHERMIAKQAERDFHIAFAEMQNNLPEIKKQGEAENKDGKKLYNYAKWEDINRAIKPVLSEYGFMLNFRIESHENGIKVTAILSRAGHSESTSIVQSLDMGGAAMNANQSRGAASAYGKRYTASALLNLVSYDEPDTDATTPLSGETLSEAQARELRDTLKKLEKDEDAFLSFMSSKGVIVASELDDVPVESFRVMQATLAGFAQKAGDANGQ